MPPVVADDGPTMGIIYPPPEVRNIVDKTASFVARNGPDFEQRIKQNEVQNPKFTFLNNGDPYHAYYQHRVQEIRDGKESSPGIPNKVQESTPTAGKIKFREITHCCVNSRKKNFANFSRIFYYSIIHIFYCTIIR